MKFYRLLRLRAPFVILVCIVTFPLLATAQQAPQPAKPAPSKPQNPFETVPQAQQPDPAKPQIQLETPKAPTPEAPKPQAGTPNVIEDVEIRGSRRVPQDTLRALMVSKRGDILDEEILQRDFMALWNTGRFDDIRLEKEATPNGWLVRFLVTERRMIRSIKYDGAKSVTISEILDRFKERKVGLSVESQYDPNKVQRAANVLREFLSERGRQFATVEPVIRQIPPSSLEIVFEVKEGPKVKVGNIEFEGNNVFSDREVRRAMRMLRPIGIPHSILFENLFAKSFDQSKLEIDQDMIRNFYQENGYFLTRVVDSEVTMRDVGGKGFRIPIIKPNRPGKRADIKLTIEEGKLMKLNKINFVGVKLFRAPDALMRPLFNMEEGDVFSTANLRKGMENLQKLYGNYGYIDMVPEPEPQPIPGTDKINLTFNIDEGKQFYVRRIEFAGNTTTRDKVIRRELLIDEGDIFNTHLWEVSILRLNQLGYFEQLKKDESATINRDPKTNTVDITLAVKERGKNSIQLNGGVSGIAGSFVGFSYSTNNFLGLGETLSIDSQLGDRIRNVTFGFTEPYLFDRPIQAGFTLYTTRFNYDQAREVSLFTGRNLIPLFEQFGTDNLLNYVSNGYGFTTFMSYPLKRLGFARWTMSYGFDTSNITTLSPSSQAYFEYINFQNADGPNSLTGIRTSKIVPSFNYNTVDHPITPTRGKSLFLATTFAGSFLGGNVNMIEPTVDAKYFRSGFLKGHVIGMHALGRFVSGYGGKVAPPFNRFYMGGENDIRGFDIWGIGPWAYVPSSAQVPVLNSDGSERLQKVIRDGQEVYEGVTQTIPVYRFIYPGGDMSVVTNFEYRIPIFGPVIVAGFFDAGINKLVRPDQLRLNPARVEELNGAYPQANFDGQAIVAEGTEALRTSTGVELQVMMPVVNAPFRLYWAYNPHIVRRIIQPPVVVDRSSFPNEATFNNAILSIGQASPLWERRTMFRFSIGRTF